MQWLSDGSNWLILGFILLIIEIFAPGVFVMWWGLAALSLATIVTLITDLSLILQLLIFVCLAITFSLFWWRYQHNINQQEDVTTLLNAREHTMIGTQGMIIELLSNGVARGKFGDTTWRVQGENLAIGDKVRVIAVEGITLQVRLV
ncbi:hypothetical protein EV693_104113 [Nicoletella semolina]|uniref:NfeD-like C-terminal domain-containing protein n=1 Tax=Nicoletella semolina TaxID=271160 RepID=A0A4R2NA68_9PAST|nr:NfeD family protein [Nicoletella semolina]MDH2925404.1 hypothetical protein [Nicoletella semolina]TCP17882.1 hypothetical protein EV693_104113 [Nicoletella semolina]